MLVLAVCLVFKFHAWHSFRGSDYVVFTRIIYELKKLVLAVLHNQ